MSYVDCKLHIDVGFSGLIKNGIVRRFEEGLSLRMNEIPVTYRGLTQVGIPHDIPPGIDPFAEFPLVEIAKYGTFVDADKNVKFVYKMIKSH